MRKKKAEPTAKLPPGEPFALDCYEDVVNLTGKIINGILGRGELKDISRQDAHTIFIGTGYLTNALREARGGQVRMSVFLQDMRSINIDNIPSEQLDRLLQGSEDVQMEILKQYVTDSNTINAEVRPIVKRPPMPQLNTKLISDMSGVEPQRIVNLLEGKEEHPAEDIVIETPKHEWVFTVNKEKRFCNKCLTEREILQPEDAYSVCSEQIGL